MFRKVTKPKGKKTMTDLTETQRAIVEACVKHPEATDAEIAEFAEEELGTRPSRSYTNEVRNTYTGAIGDRRGETEESDSDDPEEPVVDEPSDDEVPLLGDADAEEIVEELEELGDETADDDDVEQERESVGTDDWSAVDREEQDDDRGLVDRFFDRIGL